MYYSIQTFKLVNYSLTCYIRGPESRVPLENFGLPGPGSHLKGCGSWVLLDHIRVPGPGFQVPSLGPGSRVLGLGSYVSGMSKLTDFFKKDNSQVSLLSPPSFLGLCVLVL